MPPTPSPLVDCERIDPRREVPGTVRQACYGHPLAVLAPELEEHLWGSVRLVPEGALVRATCGRCGAHSEQALALPELPTFGAETPAEYVRPDDELVEYVAETVEPVMEQVARCWYPDHRPPEGCVEPVRLPDPLTDLQHQCLEGARSTVEAGQPLGAYVYLLFADGIRSALSFTEALEREPPRDRAERTRRIERVKAVGRQHVAERSNENELIGAVFLSEVWMAPVDEPGEWADPPARTAAREEGVMCQVFTRDGGRGQVAPVRRSVGDDGEVGDWHHQSWAGGRLTEGVLAPIRTVWRDRRNGWSSLGLRTGGTGVH